MRKLQETPEFLNKILYKIQSLKEITALDYDLEDEKEYNIHANILARIGNKLLAHEFRMFEVDEHNAKVLRFLLLYFNNCRAAEHVFPNEDYKLHKQIMLFGKVGTGKSLIMQMFVDYLKKTENRNDFINISVTEMINYFKLHNHLNKFTYNEQSESLHFRTNAKNVCLNDLGLDTHMHFGVDTKILIDDFLYARYELFTNYHVKAHITTNLSVPDLKTKFDFRLVDRFKAYNMIQLHGESRRK